MTTAPDPTGYPFPRPDTPQPAAEENPVPVEDDNDEGDLA